MKPTRNGDETMFGQLGTKKIRLVLAIEGTEVAIRIVPHKFDATKVMLKTLHPELALMLCSGMGIEAGPTKMGSNFFTTEVNLKDFQKGLGVFVAQAMAAQPEEAKQLPESNKCGNCGCDDGTHWPFCENHFNN